MWQRGRNYTYTLRKKNGLIRINEYEENYSTHVSEDKHKNKTTASKKGLCARETS